MSATKNQTYDPRAVANTFLEIALEEGKTLSHLKLQKLVYIANGWHLALLGTPLVSDDPEAWRHGPVYRKLYKEFREYGSHPIDSFYEDFDLEELEFYIPRVQDSESIDIIKEIWKAYGHFDAFKLSALTHQDGTPWSRTYSESYRNRPIPKELIREHFGELKERYSSSST